MRVQLWMKRNRRTKDEYPEQLVWICADYTEINVVMERGHLFGLFKNVNNAMRTSHFRLALLF